MPTMLPLPTLDDLLRLSAFDGDSIAAWRLNTELWQARYGAVGMGLIFRPDDGAPRLSALSSADGTIVIEARDPIGELGLAVRVPGLPWLGDDRAMRTDSDAAYRDSLLGRLLPAETLLLLPLYAHDGARHALLFGAPRDHPLATAPLDWMQVLANLYGAYFGGALDRRDLTERSRRSETDIQDLADVQRLLLPTAVAIGGLDYAAHYQPSAQAGGDYYDIVCLSHRVSSDYPSHWPDAFGLLIADVSGHGAGAAMEAVQFDAILRTYRGDEGDGPAGALTYANRYYFSRQPRGHFMTALGFLHLPHRRLIRLCNAGHLPPLRLRDGVATSIDTGRDIPIGILREHRFENAVLDAAEGDVYVFYTDGIVESRDRDGMEFGIERLRDIVEATAADPTAQRDAILAALFEHQGSDTGRDDQTLLVIRLGPMVDEGVA
jgi:sigma-B regulation protein RsbU (phosphoserine phosphatase)